MNRLPVVTGLGLDAIIAWQPAGPRRVRDLLADAHALAAQLPPGRHLLNVCHDRYHFAVAFIAGLLGGKVSLQPSSQSAETLARLREAFPDVFCLGDPLFAAADMPSLALPPLNGDPDHALSAIPDCPAEQVAAILFTSGSTGLPQAHRKTWGKLVANGRAEAVALGLLDHPHTLVGTVPVQHSYGFESTLLLALHGGCPFWSGKPFYPADIIAALAAVPSPRLLVTTPFHLNTLLSSALNWPTVDCVLSATAPLSQELAAHCEAHSGATVLEIYGSTETGQLAWRRTTADPSWNLLPDVQLTARGDQVVASGGHVEGEVALADRVELQAAGRFLLLGRQADLINIAGKRTSLAYLDHQLKSIPGVVDGAFLMPDDGHAAGDITRLTAFVVAPELGAAALQQALRQRIDAVFMPRPLLRVAALSRNSTGKLPRSALLAFYREQVAHAGE